MSLGANKAALLGAAGGGSAANYFGDGSDGAVTTSGDLTYTPANTSGSYIGDMVVKNYTTFTVSVGDTVTVDNGCSGMLIYCTGNCTINGTITMSQRGTTVNSGFSSNPIDSKSSIWLPMFTASPGSQTLTVAAADFAPCGTAAVAAVANQPGITGDGTLFSMAGGAGGDRGFANNWGPTSGTGGVRASGTYEVYIWNGGGAGGAASKGGGGGNVYGGYGGTASPLSGGSGGGGSAVYNAAGSGGVAVASGGAGGNGYARNHNSGGGGGAGQPGGSGATSGTGTAAVGANGNGGVIWLIVGGDLTLGASSEIESKGSVGGPTTGNFSAGGGSSGGGAAIINYAGTLTDSGCTFDFDGGAGTTGGTTASGADGGYVLTQVLGA